MASSSLWSAVGSNDLWLPAGANWPQFVAKIGRRNVPFASDLISAIAVCLGLAVMRTVLEKYLHAPFARHTLRLDAAKEGRASPPIAVEIERPGVWPLRQLISSCWRLQFYSSSLLYGCWVVMRLPCVHNLSTCWDAAFPYQKLDSGVKLYFLLTLGFHLEEMLLHVYQYSKVSLRDERWLVRMLPRLINPLLLTIAWCSNLTRITAVIVLSHDLPEPWLDAARLARSAGRSRLSTALFGVYVLVASFTRLYFMPIRILHSTLVDLPIVITGAHPQTPLPLAFYAFNALIAALLCSQLVRLVLVCRAWLSTEEPSSPPSSLSTSTSRSTSSSPVLDTGAEAASVGAIIKTSPVASPKAGQARGSQGRPSPAGSPKKAGGGGTTTVNPSNSDQRWTVTKPQPRPNSSSSTAATGAAVPLSAMVLPNSDDEYEHVAPGSPSRVSPHSGRGSGGSLQVIALDSPSSSSTRSQQLMPRHQHSRDHEPEDQTDLSPRQQLDSSPVQVQPSPAGRKPRRRNRKKGGKSD